MSKQNLPPVVMGKYFLPNTTYKRHKVALVFTRGGLGDYINFMSSILWLAETANHVYGHIYVHEPFLSVAKHILEPYKNWGARDAKLIKNLEIGTHLLVPEKQILNATGAHLMDLGFSYYAMLHSPPEGYGYLPEIKYESKKDWGLPKDYIVMTPGYTALARRVKPEYYNELCKFILSIGMTPVHLGKREFSTTETAKASGYAATIDNNYDLSVGIDLTEKTTLLEAIEIMGKARCVVGLDNGLLHLAGTTKVPIVFGHNVATVEHRQIRRREPNKTVNIVVPEELLACIGCQSRMRYIFGHRFNKCLYDKYYCLDFIFKNGCETWKKAIQTAISL